MTITTKLRAWAGMLLIDVGLVILGRDWETCRRNSRIAAREDKPC